MSVFVYFATAAAMFVCGDRIPYSRAVAACAIVAALIAMPLGWGVVVLPLSVSYLTVFLGLTAWPGRYFLKHDYSYGVYLIHCPVLVSIMVLFPSLNVWWLVAIIVISITLALAQLSWTFVESPALQFKKPIRDWLNERVKRLGIAVPMRPKT
jgi:peptidoglycan/LPS O-acetylase OafA/YrhL